MVIQNTCPNLSNIVHTDFELGRVIQTVVGADPGITERRHQPEAINLDETWKNLNGKFRRKLKKSFVKNHKKFRRI